MALRAQRGFSVLRTQGSCFLGSKIVRLLFGGRSVGDAHRYGTLPFQGESEYAEQCGLRYGSAARTGHFVLLFAHGYKAVAPNGA
jgi:hypothetical protein